MLKKHIIYIIIVCTQCQAAKEHTPTKHITVSIAPQKYFIERIGGRDIQVKVLAEQLINHQHQISIKKLQELSNTDLYIAIGGGAFTFEEKSKRQIQALTKKKIESITLFEDHGQDPHYWLSPKRVLQVTEKIYKALVKIDPQQQSLYTKGHKEFQAEIRALDLELRKKLHTCQGKSFLSYHPAWHYFAKDYGLHELEFSTAHKKISLKRIQALIHTAQQENIRTIVIPHKVFRAQVAHLHDALQAEVIILDPLAESWTENLRKVGETLHKALTKQ